MHVKTVLDVRHPETHLVAVEQTFPASDGKSRTFRMPAWVPGSYKIRDFGRHVQDATCEVAGKSWAVAQIGKDAWQVRGTAGKPVTLRFRVYCRELTVDTSHVTIDHAHLFLPTLVLYDDASRGLPHQVSVKRPRGWSVWSGLETAAFDGRLRTADDYDHLIDCPIEVGPAADYHVSTFTVRQRKHRVVWWMAPTDMDGARITKDIRAVVEETARLFGGLPYDHYLFLGHVAADHGGGLEHANSTVLGVDPLQLVDDNAIQERLLPLVAHEFFHTWNVKRILPSSFQPYDLQQEVYTDLLWMFEGFTTYYELPILARAGVVDDEHWGRLAADMLKFYEMALGRHHRSVSDCSRLTWSLLYQAHEHNINRNVSYYTKGLWVGLCLDAYLRQEGVKDGLDDVMRYLWKHHKDTSVDEDAFAGIVEASTGVNVARRLHNWVHGTTELPIDESLAWLGWGVKREHQDPKKPLGFGIHFKPGGQVIERIPEDSPAFAVLQPDDEILAIEGYKWTAKRAASWANSREDGDEVSVSLFREGRLRTLDVPLRTLEKDKITIARRKGDAAATRRRRAWLGTNLD